jgi:hypothetical protein
MAKLIVGALTPIAVLFLGIYVSRASKRFEHIQWRSQKLIEKRLAVYDDLAPLLNDLLCYFTYVGSWRDMDPPAIVALKRSIDKKVYLAAPLFSAEFFRTNTVLVNLCFQTFNEWGQDARLKTHFERRKQSRLENWKREWDGCFASVASDPTAVRDAYQDVMKAFAMDIGVHSEAEVPPTGRIPNNIR